MVNVPVGEDVGHVSNLFVSAIGNQFVTQIRLSAIDDDRVALLIVQDLCVASAVLISLLGKTRDVDCNHKPSPHKNPPEGSLPLGFNVF